MEVGQDSKAFAAQTLGITRCGESQELNEADGCICTSIKYDVDACSIYIETFEL